MKFFSLFVLSLVVFIQPLYSIPPNPKPEKLQLKESISIEGIYESSSGSVCQIKKVGDVYTIEWTNGDVGIGRWKGSITFIVSFGNPKIRAGLAIYQIDQSDKLFKLIGEWTALPGNGKWEVETLTKIK